MMPPVVDDPLFFLDYDGTLAPIVDDPMQAFPHADVPELLRLLDDRYPVWIITGRFLKDVEHLLDGSYRAIGLHGIQRGRLDGEKAFELSGAAREAIEALRASAPDEDGLRIEEKGPLFAVHYRLANDKEAARAIIGAWLSDVPDVLDPIWGKDVVELRPHGVNKGTAVRDIAAHHSNRTPVYLGDDVTDEDAFEALGDRAITIKVGEGDTIAKYVLSGPDDVVAYLHRYIH